MGKETRIIYEKAPSGYGYVPVKKIVTAPSSKGGTDVTITSYKKGKSSSSTSYRTKKETSAKDVTVSANKKIYVSGKVYDEATGYEIKQKPATPLKTETKEVKEEMKQPGFKEPVENIPVKKEPIRRGGSPIFITRGGSPTETETPREKAIANLKKVKTFIEQPAATRRRQTLDFVGGVIDTSISKAASKIPGISYLEGLSQKTKKVKELEGVKLQQEAETRYKNEFEAETVELEKRRSDFIKQKELVESFSPATTEGEYQQQVAAYNLAQEKYKSFETERLRVERLVTGRPGSSPIFKETPALQRKVMGTIKEEEPVLRRKYFLEGLGEEGLGKTGAIVGTAYDVGKEFLKFSATKGVLVAAEAQDFLMKSPKEQKEVLTGIKEGLKEEAIVHPELLAAEIGTAAAIIGAGVLKGVGKAKTKVAKAKKAKGKVVSADQKIVAVGRSEKEFSVYAKRADIKVMVGKDTFTVPVVGEGPGKAIVKAGTIKTGLKIKGAVLSSKGKILSEFKAPIISETVPIKSGFKFSTIVGGKQITEITGKGKLLISKQPSISQIPVKVKTNVAGMLVSQEIKGIVNPLKLYSVKFKDIPLDKTLGIKSGVGVATTGGKSLYTLDNKLIKFKQKGQVKSLTVSDSLIKKALQDSIKPGKAPKISKISIVPKIKVPKINIPKPQPILKLNKARVKAKGVEIGIGTGIVSKAVREAEKAFIKQVGKGAKVYPALGALKGTLAGVASIRVTKQKERQRLKLPTLPKDIAPIKSVEKEIIKSLERQKDINKIIAQPKLNVVQGLEPSQKLVPRAIMGIEGVLRSPVPPSIPKIPEFKFDIPKVPIFDIPIFSKARKRKRRTAKKTRTLIPTSASLVASALDIRGNFPDIITGFGIRPLPKRRRG